MVKLNLNVHTYMLNYQAVRGNPPTLAQIAEAVEDLNHRSSARYSVQMLMEYGLVVEEKGKWANHARRYRAVSNGCS